MSASTRPKYRMNWLPIIVIALVAIGLLLSFLGVTQGIAVIIAAFPFSILEVARLTRAGQQAGR